MSELVRSAWLTTSVLANDDMFMMVSLDNYMGVNPLTTVGDVPDRFPPSASWRRPSYRFDFTRQA